MFQHSSNDLRVTHFGKCENYHDTPMLITENEVEVSDGIHRSTVIEMNLEKDLDELEVGRFFFSIIHRK